MFSNSSIQSTIEGFNGDSFSYLVGFGMYSSSNTTYYYVMDYGASKIYILNDEWSFISAKTFTNPQYMINIGNSLYMTGWPYSVWKLDKNLNILIKYNHAGYPLYRGISYNLSNSSIYVAAYGLDEIQVFSSDLTLIRRFSTSPHNPFSITESSNNLYVGTDKGIILVYKNEAIIKQFNGCDGKSAWLTLILFDQNDYMATACSSKLYLFSPNGSFTGKSMTTSSFNFYIGFDSKGRFIEISTQQISIYN